MVAQCGPAELQTVLRLQVFVCSHHESRNPEEGEGEPPLLVDEHAVDHCKVLPAPFACRPFLTDDAQAVRGQLLDTVLSSIQLLKRQSESGDDEIISPDAPASADRTPAAIMSAEARTAAVAKVCKAISYELPFFDVSSYSCVCIAIAHS